jgi:NitT/TauT family transport system permease protein
MSHVRSINPVPKQNLCFGFLFFAAVVAPPGARRRRLQEESIMAYHTHSTGTTWVAAQSARTPWLARLRQQPHRMLTPLVLVLAILLWAGLVSWQDLPPFILPGPMLVANKFWSTLADGTLIRHAQITLVEIGLGLALGLSTACVTGYLLGKNRTLEQIASPYIVASQSVPIVAIAPLLIIWLGSGLTSKVIVCALISFFPTLIATIVGIRSVDSDLHDLMRSLRASRRQIFTKLELPSALPVLFGGLKLSVTLAVVGAVVGEFVGADAGLGFLINLGRGILDTPLMFVAVIALVLIAQALYMAVVLLENHFLRWQRQN